MTVKENEQQTVEMKPSPNDDYKNNPLLDENGNPKEVVVPPSKEEPAENKEQSQKEEQQQPKPDIDWSKLEGVQKLEKFLVDANLKPSDVTKQVIEAGGKVTPEILKALEDKYGAGVAALLADQVTDLYKHGQAKVKEQETAIFNQVEAAFKDVTQQSGEETFKELSTWAKTNIDNATRSELNKLLEAGGFQAELAVKYLVETFKGSENFQPSAKLLTADATSQASSIVPLTRQQYRAEQEKLLAKGYSESSPEMVKLDRARQLGMARGI